MARAHRKSQALGLLNIPNFVSGKCCDEGKSFLEEVPDSPATQAFISIIQRKYRNSLSNNIFFDQSKSKAFADDKINVTEK